MYFCYGCQACSATYHCFAWTNFSVKPFSVSNLAILKTMTVTSKTHSTQSGMANAWGNIVTSADTILS